MQQKIPHQGPVDKVYETRQRSDIVELQNRRLHPVRTILGHFQYETPLEQKRCPQAFGRVRKQQKNQLLEWTTSPLTFFSIPTSSLLLANQGGCGMERILGWDRNGSISPKRRPIEARIAPRIARRRQEQKNGAKCGQKRFESELCGVGVLVTASHQFKDMIRRKKKKCL